MDRNLGEGWKYGGKKIKKWLWKFCNRIWKGEEWPESWKDAEVVPLVKKGEDEKVSRYGGVTLMPTTYKIYAIMLADRIGKVVEKEGLIPTNQAEFRKGMGTLDNVYILNYLVNRQVGKEGG